MARRPFKGLTWYCDEGSPVQGNGKSIDSPLPTFADAWALARSGDTIYMVTHGEPVVVPRGEPPRSFKLIGL